MIESILKNKNQLLPCSAYLQGQYGLENIFLGVPCLLGSQGVGKVLEVDLTDVEHSALINCEQSMRQSIEMAQKILNI